MDVNRHIPKLLKYLRKEFAEWVVNETTTEMFRDDPPLVYEAYLAGENKVRRLAGRSDKLSTWHFNQYANAALNEERYAWDEFALSARYARATVQFESAYAEAGQRGSIVLGVAPFYFCLSVLAGWREDADMVGRLLVRGLDTSLLDLRHTDRHDAGTLYRHLWFILHLYCSAKGVQIDTKPYSYPDDMSPYAAVLADWRTSDVTRVQQFVLTMADFHAQEARQTKHDEIAEFDFNAQMLFPYEILAFLRLREWLGLPNPQSFEHPLMKQPLAAMPPQPLPQPSTPLLDRVIEKFKQEYPGSFA